MFHVMSARGTQQLHLDEALRNTRNLALRHVE
jgi:hypothetical protein